MIEKIRDKSLHSFSYWNVVVRALAISTVNSPYKQYEGNDKLREVNPKDVIVTLWNKPRYESLKKGNIKSIIQKHPPRLVGYRINDGRIIYIPSDGNHRIIVAKEEGIEEIPAIVGVVYGLGSGVILIDKMGAWFKRSENEYSLITHLNEDEKKNIGDIVYLLSMRGYNPIIIR